MYFSLILDIIAVELVCRTVQNSLCSIVEKEKEKKKEYCTALQTGMNQ